NASANRARRTGMVGIAGSTSCESGPLLQLDLAQALFEEAVGGDRLGVAAGVVRRDARGQHVDQEIGVWMQEERHRIARLARGLTRGIDPAVDGPGVDEGGQ